MQPIYIGLDNDIDVTPRPRVAQFVNENRSNMIFLQACERLAHATIRLKARRERGYATSLTALQEVEDEKDAILNEVATLHS